ncbi:NEDD8 ultimate buster 1 [Betta splendens]|uniref:NEDD8 ultimate buster 1 n=1 Tax=Betta splendens TaxID=158456 RepID=A0A6P7MCS7_BETSP|nr:NEDD8 ultimate buster 1 [Betta splendens]XP_029003735.1 NEDD8 ultimate buster 1 [Betta splendens]XP_029003736.1 NEDD8 ultimate buster 1 [Betta splendens]
MMEEQNVEAKLKNLLKKEKIQLWKPPYTNDNNQPGQQHIQELAKLYAPQLCLPVLEVEVALESIRVQAVNRGKRNEMFRQTNVATLELLLPRDARKDPKTKNRVEMRLDALGQDLVNRIIEEHGLKCIKLILSGKTLSSEKRLNEQDVKNHSKIMVLRVTDSELKLQILKEEEEKKNQDKSLQRTQKGFQILSERDGSEDPRNTPFLEIADQRGNPLAIPDKERKALILAMGFHEKGRSLMKRKQYDNAVCHLLRADEEFRKCNSGLLSTVDNFAVLQLDIVWCHRALEALSCLDDARSRLQTAEQCFLHCYGEEQERLRTIKGNTGREQVLFLRLYLLQSLLSYLEGNDSQAGDKLSKVESLYSRLHPDSDKMNQLMVLGFSEREARLALRACQGDLQEAVDHITSRRQEQEEMKQRERQKRRSRMDNISTLTEMGYSRRQAARALHRADGDINKACGILLDTTLTAQANNNTEEDVSPEKLAQLLYLGFEMDASEAALRQTGGDVQSATELLLNNHGFLPVSPASTSSEEPSTSSEEPSTSSNFAEDVELVSEVLEDISHHEEDYLDLTLEEESELINEMKSYLNRGAAHDVKQ